MMCSTARRIFVVATLVLFSNSLISDAANTPAYFQLETAVGNGPPFPTEPIIVGIHNDVAFSPATLEGKFLNTVTANSNLNGTTLTQIAIGAALDFSTMHFNLVSSDPFTLSGAGILDLTYQFDIQDPPGTPLGDPPFLFATDSSSNVDGSFEVDFVAANLDGHKAGGGGTGVGRVGGKLVAMPGTGVNVVDFNILDPTVDDSFGLNVRLQIFDPMGTNIAGNNLLQLTLTGEILAVPEPASACLAGLALIGLSPFARRR